MGFRPVSQCLRDVNLQALGKFSCLALILSLESVNHSAGPVQAPSFNQDTASPSFTTPLGLEGPARARAETWDVSLFGAINVRDELRRVF